MDILVPAGIGVVASDAFTVSGAPPGPCGALSVAGLPSAAPVVAPDLRGGRLRRRLDGMNEITSLPLVALIHGRWRVAAR